MQVVVATHPSAREHDTGLYHPDAPERVDAVLTGIADAGLQTVNIESPEIQRSELALVHEPSYIQMIQEFCALGGGHLDMDTMVTEKSWEAALTAAGGVKASIEELSRRDDATAFAVTRPPGHHALPDRAMGFCLFNNVAISAALLRSQGNRVAILDWDVHHGNGTQSMVMADSDILYVSIHQSSFYPFEGAVDDVDRDAKGTTINIPLPARSAGDVFRKAWGEIVMPVVAGFQPDWVLISAGFDSHVEDPLGELRFLASDYGWAANQLSEAHPPQRTVLALEGGYDLNALRDSTRATLLGLSGMDHLEEPLTSPPRSFDEVEKAAEAVSRHWRLADG